METILPPALGGLPGRFIIGGWCMLRQDNGKPVEIDFPAIADRVEIAFNALISDTVGAQSIKVDRAGFRRAIDYYRYHAAKANENADSMPQEECEACELIRMHNLPMSWIYEGDMMLTILHLAVGTGSQRKPELRVNLRGSIWTQMIQNFAAPSSL